MVPLTVLTIAMHTLACATSGPALDSAPENTTKAGGIDSARVNARWAARSRDAREALRGNQYREAETAFVDALLSLADPRRTDVRVQTTLGNLVRLASIYRRLDRSDDASRVISFVDDYLNEHANEHANLDPADQQRDSQLAAAYRLRYQNLSEQPLAFAYRPSNAFPDEPVEFEPSLEGLIRRTARKYRVDPHLVKAVVAAESNFDVLAVSAKGAQGLMQLMPATAREMGVRKPFKPSENIRGGVKYLRTLLDRYASISIAIAAYNAGPVAVDRYGGIPPFPETQAYVKRVLRYYHEYRDELKP